jgi:hypothetical protein
LSSTQIGERVTQIINHQKIIIIHFLAVFLLTFRPLSVIIIIIEQPDKELEIYVSNIRIRGQKPMSIIKNEAKKLIDKLPEQATWDDIMYEFYVKK